MRSTNIALVALCTPFLFAYSIAARAVDANEFYGNIGIGQDGFRMGAASLLSVVKANDRIASLNYWNTTDAQISSNRDTGYQLRLGYRINDRVALEAGYSDLGKMGFSATQEFICPVCSYPGGGIPKRQVTGDIRANGVDVNVVGNIPLSAHWSLLGRLGVIAARVTTVAPTEDFSSFGVPFATRLQATASNTSPLAGLGIEWAPAIDIGFLPVTTRFEWTRYKSLGNAKTGESDVDSISASVVLKF